MLSLLVTCPCILSSYPVRLNTQVPVLLVSCCKVSVTVAVRSDRRLSLHPTSPTSPSRTLLSHLDVLHSDGLPQHVSSPQTSSNKNPGAHWPSEFYADFTSRVWITFCSHFYPIQDSSLTVVEREQTEAAAAGVTNTDLIQPSIKTLVARRREGMDE